MLKRIITLFALPTVILFTVAVGAVLAGDIFYPTDDASVVMGNPNHNYGWGEGIKVKNRYGASDGWECDALVKFDLSSIPGNATIESAELNLYYYQYDDNNPTGRDLTVYKINEDWDESTVTFNNQPPTEPYATSYSIVPDHFDWMKWDVTTDVQNYINGQTVLYGWKVMDTTYWGWFNIPITFFRSKDYDNPEYFPYLEVEYSGGGGSNISVEIIPDNPPIEVAQGGSFTYTGTLTNNTDDWQTPDIWTVVRPYGGYAYGPMEILNDYLLLPHATMTAPGIIQHIPWNAPLDTYEYIAYCGDYPFWPVDSSSFDFTVVHSNAISGGTDEWTTPEWSTEEVENVPSECNLIGNYPNPFNPTTNISFNLPQEGKVSLKIYDLMGREVATLIDGIKPAGHHSVVWDATDSPSGIYFYKLTIGNKTFTKRMTLLK